MNGYPLGRVGRPPDLDPLQYVLTCVPYVKTPVVCVVQSALGLAPPAPLPQRAIYV